MDGGEGGREVGRKRANERRCGWSERGPGEVRRVPYELCLPNLRDLRLVFLSEGDTPASFSGFFSVLEVCSCQLLRKEGLEGEEQRGGGNVV